MFSRYNVYHVNHPTPSTHEEGSLKLNRESVQGDQHWNDISGSVTTEYRAFKFHTREDNAVLAVGTVKGSSFLTGRSKEVCAAEPSTCSTTDKGEELEYIRAKPQVVFCLQTQKRRSTNPNQ